jgi:predicted lipoprotein with Yx(FWY)xxD motif
MHYEHAGHQKLRRPQKERFMLKSPRPILYLSTVLVLLLLLAACGGQEEATPTPEPEPTATPEPAVEPEPTEAPAEVEEEPTEAVAEEEAPMVSNAVVVSDQALSESGTVTVASVTSDTAGWLVIHAQADGSPGPILGRTQVSAGENNDVVVEIDPAGATETLYAMLHVDAGTAGEFEFPGEDGPALDAEGNVVTPSFDLTGGSPVATTILLAESDALGSYLTDAAGMTLYTFARDEPGTSNCYDQCALAWPPLLAEEGSELAAGEGIPGELGTTERDDGTVMVTYNGWPLYYWVNDEAPGDTTGHNVGNVWAVAFPETHVFLGGNEELGSFLVDPEGFTLYRFNPDEPGVSNCTDQCAASWPPLLIEDGQQPNGNAGVVGQLGTIERDDGTIQVTYEGMPLYRWVNDGAPGDATGQGVNDVWFVMPPYTVAVSDNDELGDFLVGNNGMTLYMFTQDEENVSNCTDQCTANWPPLVVHEGEVPVAGHGVVGELNVIERDDGTFQVTYNGMPLYFWVNDGAPGDTNGQGVGDVWFVVPPDSETDAVSSSDGYNY